MTSCLIEPGNSLSRPVGTGSGAGTSSPSVAACPGFSCFVRNCFSTSCCPNTRVVHDLGTLAREERWPSNSCTFLVLGAGQLDNPYNPNRYKQDTPVIAKTDSSKEPGNVPQGSLQSAQTSLLQQRPQGGGTLGKDCVFKKMRVLPKQIHLNQSR